MRRIIFTLILMSIVMLAAGKTLNIESTIEKNAVVIDGSDEEWEGKRVYNDKDDVIFGVQNDEESLYVLFISRDSDLERQMLVNGFTLWINDKGKTKKICGLNIPGMERERMQNKSQNQNRREVDNSRENKPEDMMQEKLSIKPEFLFLTDKENDHLAYSNNELNGFDFARAQGDRGVVYEFKIPLHKKDDQIFGFQEEDQKKIALGLECEAPEREEMKMGMGGRPDGGMPEGGRPGGDMPQGGGRPGGDMGGEMHGGGMPSQKDYDLWVKIGFID